MTTAITRLDLASHIEPKLNRIAEKYSDYLRSAEIRLDVIWGSGIGLAVHYEQLAREFTDALVEKNSEYQHLEVMPLLKYVYSIKEADGALEELEGNLETVKTLMAQGGESK